MVLSGDPILSINLFCMFVRCKAISEAILAFFLIRAISGLAESVSVNNSNILDFSDSPFVRLFILESKNGVISLPLMPFVL